MNFLLFCDSLSNIVQRPHGSANGKIIVTNNELSNKLHE